MSADNCIFCKIIGSEESEKTVVFENDAVIAIKPRDEVAQGHTLVIPKEHHRDIFDIPAQSLKELIVVSQQLAKSLTEKYRASGVNILHASGADAGQSVFHFHIHVVPRYPDDGLDLWLKEK
jgi:histidine triad (HIT) family protein